MGIVVSRLTVAAGLIMSLCLVLAISASAEMGVCSFGSDAGQCEKPSGIAAARSNGSAYVADTANNRIDVFNSVGAFQFAFGWGVADGTTNALQTCGPAATPPSASCFAGLPGSGAGQLAGPRRVAVDNEPTSPNFHDIYVADNSLRVQRFSSSGALEATVGTGVLLRENAPIGVGPAGNLYVFDAAGPGAEEREVKVFTPAGVAAGSSDIPGVLIGDATVDSSGDVYVNRTGTGAAIEKYELSEPTATLLDSFDPGANTKALAVDGEDNLYAVQGSQGVVTKRDPSGNIVKRFGYGEIEFSVQGLAVGASGDLYASEEYVGAPSPGNRVILIPQPPDGPLACCLAIEPGNTKATLKGQVNPEGSATTYHFEYLTDADFIANGNSFAGPNPPSSTPESGSVGADFTLHPAEAAIGCPSPSDPPQAECLKPATLYHFRLVVDNADGENASEGSFETLPPFEIKATWATGVGTDRAEIHATVNPQGIAATGFFEYVDDAGFQADLGSGGDGFGAASKVPATPIAFGGGNADASAGVALASLSPGTTYHYRVVVADSFVPDGKPGPERTFNTYPLPTPQPPCANDGFRVGASAFLPDCRAYEMVSPVDKNGGDIKVLINITNYPTRLDQSAADGDSFTYSAIPAFADPQSAPFVSQYMAKRSEAGWSNRAINPPRESVPLTDQVVRLDVQYKLFSDDLTSGWLFQDANPALDACAPEGFINLYRRDDVTGDYEALIPANPSSLPPEGYRLELQGASADGTRAVFRADAKLTKDAAAGDAYQLYEHVKGEGCGELRLVSFKPNGVAGTQAGSAGSPAGPGEYRESALARAVSVDGRRVFFTLSNNEISTGPLYVRINADQPQSTMSGGKCSQPAKGCTLEVSATTARFRTAATDGSKAIYSVGNELFEYDVEKGLAEEPASTLIAKSAIGVAGASEDASRIYFVSTEEIDGEGVAGKPNLYLYEAAKAGAERYRLVATLAGTDVLGLRYWGFAVGATSPIQNGVRVTADGAQMAFVSSASITGYDNLDASDGRPNLEVYLYDRAEEAVRCISCNPSGSRPSGREFVEGPASLKVSAQMAPAENQSFAPRALSADGNRLFFESFESLLPRDVNKKADVYEWERAPSADACKALGAELHVPAAGGCLSLISSGQEEADSEFADASPDGSDVFIRTSSSLLPQDSGQVDVYDAREGGGFPPPPTPVPPCEGEACAGPAQSPPNDPTPATQGPSAGNVPSKKPCPKGKVRNKKGKCVKKHRKAKHHHNKKASHKKKGARR